ncbi:hypothetical protein HJB86_21380 [Rhizobium sp. NZLR3b]|uniref:hypothetical protein n=1 Tax=Rhizobium sp. NZLR3b TaxID=2731101 RepID=UPI001C8351C1|nr:hypothetical protein [Rhizobium sp. NZLR3b]MBX5191436.1 hypothetical protein [Rhizobium sp. NZLR3b]
MQDQAPKAAPHALLTSYPLGAGEGHSLIKELFELLAYYIVRVVGPYWITMALAKIGVQVFPAVSQHPKGFLVAIVVSFAAMLIAPSFWLDDGGNQERRQRFRRMASPFAYPIILIAGLWGGYRYCEYVMPQTEQGRQYRAALSACMELQTCVRRMQDKVF